MAANPNVPVEHRLAPVFRRSRNLAIVGIPLVAVGSIVVATTMGSGEANPKDALAIIFALIGGFVFLLLFVQGREISAAAAGSEVPASAIGSPIDNPMTIPEPELWAALAIEPIGSEALKARSDAWGIAKDSHRAAWIVCGMIFVFVPASYLLEEPAIAVFGAIPIAGYAVYRAIRVVGGGGDLDRGYESLGVSVAPLGLAVDERPTVGVAQRMAPTPGLKTDIRGELRLSGDRHGRPVTIVMADGATEVRIGIEVPAFEARSSDGKVRAKAGKAGDPPPEIDSALRLVPASVDWKNVRAKGGAEGISIRRKPAAGRHWLADLWLAERIADAAGA